jgi:hypothetical protein
MGLRTLGAWTMVAAFLSGTAAATDPHGAVPRFSLSASTATTNDAVTLRVEQPLRLSNREIRLYLVPAAFAAAIRSRFDQRLSFIGSVRSTRNARMLFTVPPLDAGNYALAYWCRGCLPLANGVTVPASPRLRFHAPTGTACPRTTPNDNLPPGAPSTAFRFHGNGSLWALLPNNGVLTTNSLGGYKLIWVAKPGVSDPLAVRYRLLADSSPPLIASAISGSLTGYPGPSWASRMSFQPGCWQITGRLQDAAVSFVTQVVLGDH